jgi:hypothetical protein
MSFATLGSKVLSMTPRMSYALKIEEDSFMRSLRG